MSSSDVVLPTPLRPTMATVSPAPTDRLRRSTIVVGPHPPVRPTRSSIARPAGEARLPGTSQIDGAYIGRGHHVGRRAGHQYPAVHKHAHLGREAAHHVHVMLYHQDGD